MTMTKSPVSSQYRWFHELKQLFVLGIERHRSGELSPEKHFNEPERAFLASVGLTAHELFDFVDDHVRYDGDPEWENILLINAVRRDYFLSVQQGQWSTNLVSTDDLPAKDVQLDGIRWLPRMIKKAEAKLRGEMPPDLMYGCAGDRNFLREHGLNAADFLRNVWSAKGDEQKVLAYVRGQG